jgi:uncharacterized membrane protein
MLVALTQDDLKWLAASCQIAFHQNLNLLGMTVLVQSSSLILGKSLQKINHLHLIASGQ